MHVDGERARLPDSDRVGGQLGGRPGHRWVLRTGAPPIQASLHRHLSDQPAQESPTELYGPPAAYNVS
jgi:hypothetical protein